MEDLPDPTYDFFIAYAAPDKATAERLYQLLAPASRPFLDCRCLLLGDNWDLELPRAQRNSRIKSRTVCHRSSGSFARHVATTRSSARGAAGCAVDTGGGSSFRIAPSSAPRVLPSNAFRPVSIS